MEIYATTAPMLLLLMTVGGALLLGVSLAIGSILTRRQREDPVAQGYRDAGTREL
jgi:hypothetical protein